MRSFGALGPALAILVAPACGGLVVVERTSDSAGAGGAGGAPVSATSSAASAGGDQGAGGFADAGTQCSCKDEATFAPCALPLMCCPCTQHCEDPETFSCSCSDVPACL